MIPLDDNEIILVYYIFFLGLANTGYDYDQHMRPISGEGVYINRMGTGR